MSSLESLTIKAKKNTAYQIIFVLCITVIAAALRFYKLGEWSFWIEELHSIRTINNLAYSLSSIASNTRPVFYLMSKPILDVLGVNEWTTRLLPTIIGIITIPILYWLTKKLFGVSVAVIAAILLSLAPWHIYWSQNARFYTLLLLLTFLSSYAFYLAIEQDNITYIYGSIGLFLLAGATHAIAALLIPIFLLYFVLLKLLPFEKPKGLRFTNLLPFCIVLISGYLFYEIFRVMIGGKQLLIFEIYYKFFDETTASFIGYASPKITITATAYYLGAPLVLLALIGSGLLLIKRDRAGLFVSLAAFFPLGLITVLTLFASTSNRYVFMSLPYWIILAAYAVTIFLKKYSKNSVILVLSLLGIFVLLYRDPAIRDIFHFLSQENAIVLYMIILIVCGLIFTSLLLQLVPTLSKRYSFIGLGSVILVILIAHAVMVDYMYYAYQHGHRENWKDATAFILEEKINNEPIYVAAFSLGDYYLKKDVHSVKKDTDLFGALEKDDQVWFIENADMEQRMGSEFEGWATTNCVLVNNWDTFTGGRYWKMRVHHCGKISSILTNNN